MLAVATPAADRSLLTLAELRAATGVATGSVAELTALGAGVAASITAACMVAPGGAAPPTLRLETLTETLRPDASHDRLALARRPIVAVASVVEGDAAVDAAGYEIDASAAILLRLCDDRPSRWPSAKIVVVYQAGWAVVPDDLKLAATKLARLLWSAEGRDPLLKRERVRTDDVEEIEADYWVGPVDGAALPADVADLIRPYMNLWVG